MRALSQAKRDGRTKHIGVANFTLPLIEEAVKLSTEPLVTNQIEVHPYLDQSKVIAACRRHGLSVTAYCPLARGRVPNDEVLTRIGNAHGKTASQVALRWLVQQGIVPIPRSSNPDKLAANLAIFDFALSDARDGRDRRAQAAGRAGGQSAARAEVGRLSADRHGRSAPCSRLAGEWRPRFMYSSDDSGERPMTIVEANGARIPAIGLGTWKLEGRNCARLVQQALRLGYRHIDTAEIYENEREVGEGLRASGVRREDVFITTKVWSTHLAPRDLAARRPRKAWCGCALSDVNLLLIHWPNPRIPLAETIGALCRMKSEGYARHIGVSNFTVPLLEEARRARDRAAGHQPDRVAPYLDQRALVAATRKHGLAVTAYSPIARGKAAADKVLATIGMNYGKTAGQVALRFLVQQGAIVIPRTSKVERLSENMAIFDFELTAEEMAEIAKLARPDGSVL